MGWSQYLFLCFGRALAAVYDTFYAYVEMNFGYKAQEVCIKLACETIGYGVVVEFGGDHLGWFTQPFRGSFAASLTRTNFIPTCNELPTVLVHHTVSRFSRRIYLHVHPRRVEPFSLCPLCFGPEPVLSDFSCIVS